MQTSDPLYEGKLLQQIARGDEKAFADLFYAYKDKLYSFLLQLSDETTAQDMVQEVFLKIWTGREKLAEVENVNAYIYRMAKNHALNSLKRSAHYESILKEKTYTAQSNISNTEETIQFNELTRQLNTAIEQLPPQQKKVYQMSREGGLKLEEIAQQMDLSYSTVKNHLIAALRNLRDKLGADHPSTVIALVLAIAELLKD